MGSEPHTRLGCSQGANVGLLDTRAVELGSLVEGGAGAVSQPPALPAPVPLLTPGVLWGGQRFRDRPSGTLWRPRPSRSRSQRAGQREHVWCGVLVTA